MSTNHFLSLVIAVGRDGLGSVASQDRPYLEPSPTNIAPNEWQRICARLPRDASLDLFRGLVLCEREFRWLGGSVAANVWVLRALYPVLSEPERDALIDWALRNRGNNEYTPTGFRTSARSFEELAEERRRSAERRRSDLARIEAESTAAAERRVQKRRHATDHAARAKTRRSARRDFIVKLELLPYEDRIAAILEQSEFSIRSMPESLFPLDLDVFAALSAAKRERMRSELNGVRGHWRRLGVALDTVAPTGRG